MSYSTPPGWYPVLEPGPDGLPRERWWDGAAWTDEYRPPGQGGAAAPQDALPDRPAPPGRRRTVLVTAGLVVLALAAGTAFWLGRDGGDGKQAQLPPPSATVSTSATPSPSPSPSSSPTPSPTPTETSEPIPSPAVPSSTPLQSFGSLPDTTHGWRVPLPAGWKNNRPDGDSVLLNFTTRPYDCSIGDGSCARGVFEVIADAFSGSSAQAVAEERMEEYAPLMFGKLSSHRRLASGPVTVAGVPGYAERWQVDPATGVNGQAVVVAVPSAGGGYAVLVGSVDEHPDAPPAELLDQLIAAIRPLATQGGT
ncbi:DUF2510 domain-containing protein [Kitasatospora sp. NPDC001664]